MTDEFSKDSPSDPDAETLESQPERTRGGMPREIGRYKVRRTIGSGGMGTVYEAIQESPRRKVAIKVMRSGVTSRSAMRRFEYEEALNWMTKTIAFAGEDHEKLEKFREKLTQLNTLIKTGIFDMQIDTYEDPY